VTWKQMPLSCAAARLVVNAVMAVESMKVVEPLW
jgi:hypothetical protein